jgi:hypothetical protein
LEAANDDFIVHQDHRIDSHTKEENIMKRQLLTVALALCALPLTALAGTKQSASIDLGQAVVISGTHLQPGQYVVRWDGSGSDVKVKFLKGNKELVSVPAKLISQNNAMSPAVRIGSAEDGSQTINEIDLSKITLKFTE